MRVLPALMLSLLALLPAQAQNPDTTKPGFDLALPNHPGRLTFQAPAFTIVEASAKPSGSEFGLRGQDKADSTELLAFLFLFPEQAPKTAVQWSEKCRDAMIGHEKVDSPKLSLLPSSDPAHTSPPIALAHYRSSKYTYVRAFVAHGDLCSDISIYSAQPISPESPQVHTILSSLTLDPSANANFRDLTYYAATLFAHNQPAAAAPVYAKALTMIPADDPGRKWQRYTTDQAAMSYGMAGDLKQSRAIAQHAIEIDPDYPLNYYNLACADAESGDAANARIHLEQAFARKANTLPGEKLPNPANDDSIMKLKSDKSFWAFVQTLH